MLEQLVVPFRVTGAADTRDFIGVLLQLSEALRERHGELCTLHEMSPEYARERAIDENGRINCSKAQRDWQRAGTAISATPSIVTTTSSASRSTDSI